MNLPEYLIITTDPRGSYIILDTRTGEDYSANSQEQLENVVTALSKLYIPVGDAVAKMTKAVGITPCAPCEERRKKFNKAIRNPFSGARKYRRKK